MQSEKVTFCGREIDIRTFTVDDMIEMVTHDVPLHTWTMIKQVMKAEDREFFGKQPAEPKVIAEAKKLVEAFNKVNPAPTKDEATSFLQKTASTDSGGSSTSLPKSSDGQ